MKHFLRTPYWQLKLPTAINGLRGFFAVKARFHYERGKKHSLFVLLLFFCARFNFNRSLQSKINKREKECFFPRGKEHSLFVLLLFFALASILTARFNRRSIKETKNALFHARTGNGPLDIFVCYWYFELGTPYIRYWANIHTVCKRLSHSIGPIHACIVKEYRYNIVPISHCFLGKN